MIQETTPLGTINYTYDAAGRRTSMTVAGQPAVNYSYDAAGRLTGINATINGNPANFGLSYTPLLVIEEAEFPGVPAVFARKDREMPRVVLFDERVGFGPADVTDQFPKRTKRGGCGRPNPGELFELRGYLCHMKLMNTKLMNMKLMNMKLMNAPSPLTALFGCKKRKGSHRR